MSYVVAIQDVSDPERFWSGAKEAVGRLPQGITLHATYPQQDGSKAVCLWEAESVDAVRRAVEEAVGGTSRNQFFEVDSQHAGARGLPTQSTSAA